MGSSQTMTVGYEYFGSFAQALGLGPATRLTRVTNGETEIWSGDIDPTSRDGDGKTTLTTSLGSVHFYWGRDDQNPDAFLTAAEIDFGSGPVTLLIPAWRHLIYYVAEDLAWGSAPVPPSLKFEFERAVSDLSLTAHTITGDAVIPEVIYNLLTDALAGAGVDAADLDTAAFNIAAEAIIDEGLGASPYLDENTTVREFVGLLLNYIEGYLRYEAGLVTMGLIRNESIVGLTELDESNLAAEPHPKNTGWGNTWNFTRVTFTDRENQWEDASVETYDDPANAAITGERVDEEVRLPFVTRRAVAKLLAKRKGIRGGMPAMQWELEVLPSLRGLQPGDRALLSFAKLGLTNRVVRIVEVGRDAGSNRVVKLTVEEERTRDESNDYVIPADDFFSEPDEFALAATTPRLSWLTTELKNGKPDGFLVACHRPVPLAEGVEVYWSWDPVQKAYGKLGSRAAFPAKGELAWWSRCRNNTAWLLRINFQRAADAQFVITLLADSGEFYAAVGRRLFKAVGSTINQHQPDVLWLQAVADGYLNVVSATELELEFTGGAFGSVDPALETLAGQGVYPTLHIYVGRVVIGGDDDFMTFAGNLQFERTGANAAPVYTRFGLVERDTELKRHIAVTTYNAQRTQELADAGETYYDRDDTAMSPSGTYSTDWGVRVPTLAERLDLAGFAAALGGVHPDETIIVSSDQALYRAVFELDSDDDFLLTEDADDILGHLTFTSATWYNKV